MLSTGYIPAGCERERERETFWTKPEAWTCWVYTLFCRYALQFWSRDQAELPSAVA